jgi:hypothetical protein
MLRTSSTSSQADTYKNFARSLTANENADEFEKLLTQFYLQAKAKEIDPVENLDALLEDSFVVCEGHDDPLPKLFLMRNMLKLKQAGFTTLFIEHLFYDRQKGIDDYCLGRYSDEARGVELSLKELDDRNFGLGHEMITKYLWSIGNFTALAQMARRAGIRIVAIDTQFSYMEQCNSKHYNFFSGKHLDDFRIRSMNYTAYKIMTEEMKKNGGKFVSLMGLAHPKTHKNVIGVAELLGVRAVFAEYLFCYTQLEVSFNTQYAGTTIPFVGTPLEVIIRNGSSGKVVWTPDAIPVVPEFSPTAVLINSNKGTLMEGCGMKLHSGPVRLWSSQKPEMKPSVGENASLYLAGLANRR